MFIFFKGIVPKFVFYRSNLIVLMEMWCGIARFGLLRCYLRSLVALPFKIPRDKIQAQLFSSFGGLLTPLTKTSNTTPHSTIQNMTGSEML